MIWSAMINKSTITISMEDIILLHAPQSRMLSTPVIMQPSCTKVHRYMMTLYLFTGKPHYKICDVTSVLWTEQNSTWSIIMFMTDRILYNLDTCIQKTIETHWNGWTLQ